MTTGGKRSRTHNEVDASAHSIHDARQPTGFRIFLSFSLFLFLFLTGKKKIFYMSFPPPVLFCLPGKVNASTLFDTRGHNKVELI